MRSRRGASSSGCLLSLLIFVGVLAHDFVFRVLEDLRRARVPQPDHPVHVGEHDRVAGWAVDNGLQQFAAIHRGRS